jgi:hypothetical protein
MNKRLYSDEMLGAQQMSAIDENNESNVLVVARRWPALGYVAEQIEPPGAKEEGNGVPGPTGKGGAVVVAGVGRRHGGGGCGGDAMVGRGAVVVAGVGGSAMVAAAGRPSYV